jgi:hypothetical protein
VCVLCRFAVAHALATFLGENDNELIQGYALALAPFQAALVGDVKSVRGFRIIGDGLDLSSARRVFAVIDTNTQAADGFKDTAYQRVHDYLRTYGHAVASRNADGLVALRWAS